MRVILSSPPARTLTSSTFEDLTPTRFLGVVTQGDAYVLDFDGDLDVETQHRVVRRATTSVKESDAVTQLLAARTTLTNFVALQDPTPAEVAAQVKFQARALNFLVARLLGDYSST